ncbi:28S ribosomal protein S31, mitochondrial isoform X2 [Hypanus sabinus]|uniref:28S ribosomal protein S31, mitochondrial isoform X2 n=1 Tax=Hypanus sabinus TaxID=79690 RepID=UPI0028C4D35B|nr:28S ribosomal protein S31, mitochondrial isoform X2 [Hypanus sabinus]
MQRAAVLVVKRGAARRQGCGLCLLTGTGQRPIFTGSAGLKNDNEVQQVTAPKPQENAEKKEAALQVRNGLLNLIGGMKVEISTKRKLQALRTERIKDKMKAKLETMESTTSMFQHATEEIKNQSNKTLSPDLVAAASAVASSMPHNKKQIESDLLQQLRKHESETEAQKNGDVSNIGNIIANMKVGKRPGARAGFRSASEIHFDDDGQGYVPHRGVTSEFDALRKRKGIYTGKRLNIFPARMESESIPESVPVSLDAPGEAGQWLVRTVGEEKKGAERAELQVKFPVAGDRDFKGGLWDLQGESWGELSGDIVRAPSVLSCF